MLKIFETDNHVAQAVNDEMTKALNVAKPVFCLASGSTPAKGYDLFAKSTTQDLAHLQIVSLDEWVGIEQDNVGSCYQMLNQDLFSKINVKAEQITFYDGTASNMDEECTRIDNFIIENPITFSLMGVGMNGHIGLNEPGFPVVDYSSVVALSDVTKNVAQKYFTEQTHLEQGITLGLEQIIKSKRVLVVITGEHKADIVKEIFTSESGLPAQCLLGYEHIDFYIDEAAAKYLDSASREVLL